jgi:para-aminobenzoate synthetase component 1
MEIAKPIENLTASPFEVASGLRELRAPGIVFLDSNAASARNDLSIVTAFPVKSLHGHLRSAEDVSLLRAALNEVRPTSSRPDTGFPSAGLFGAVDFHGSFEFGLYERILVFDHPNDQWLDSGGFMERNGIDTEALVSPSLMSAPQVEFKAHKSREWFVDAVQRAQEYIAAGDIYQVNLAHAFRAAWPKGADPIAFYSTLREVSPAPFAAYLDFGTRQVLSASPESFLKLSGNVVSTSPIKGTRPRYRDRERDEKSAYDLLTSPKEVAELIMITDLERNDLGRVCEFGSVQVTDLLKIERFEHVFHLVSTVNGQLRPDVDHLAALQACFPGGSITGAPKKRATEILEELEDTPRGLYTGSIGYLGANGESQFNIAIRTAVVEHDVIHFHVGAGIVADSDPEMEHEETLHKAAGILLAAERSTEIRGAVLKSQSRR